MYYVASVRDIIVAGEGTATKITLFIKHTELVVTPSARDKILGYPFNTIEIYNRYSRCIDHISISCYRILFIPS